jgi:DNA invertase Pin-like site-specific DNA recombinase
VWEFDWLGRSLRDLITMLDDLPAGGVKFHSLTEAIDTATPTGRAMWQMIGVLAELERRLISERTRAGVKAAQRRDVKFGRNPVAGRPGNSRGSAQSFDGSRLIASSSKIYRVSRPIW